MRNNVNLKHIVVSLSLSKREIREIMGGGVSLSQVDGWLRSDHAAKTGSGNSSANSLTRFREMTDDQFDEFCGGLVTWVKRNFEA